MKSNEFLPEAREEYALYIEGVPKITSINVSELEEYKEMVQLNRAKSKLPPINIDILPVTSAKSDLLTLYIDGEPFITGTLVELIPYKKEAEKKNYKIEIKKESVNESKMLSEGMTFSPTVLRNQPDGTIYADTTPFYKEVRNPCPECNGKGTYPKYDDPSVQVKCAYCYGTGYWKEWEPLAPELDVSNDNGFLIQQILGLDPDYAGTIMHKDLPAIMRKLIALKNRNTDQYTREPSVSQGPMRARTDDQGMTSIGRGATMIDAGVNSLQINRYVDKLIELVKFAQENNASIGWG